MTKEKIKIPQIWMTVSAFQIPLRDASVDAAVCIRLSHHLPTSKQREDLLAELLRVARRYVIVTCLILFFFGLGAVPINDIDESMHAATSKDMVLSGDWVTPRFNGENFYDKTPLYNWLAAISFFAFWL